MNSILISLLKTFRHLYRVIKIEQRDDLRNHKMFQQKDYANDLIYNKLILDEPVMIARFGSTELATITNYLGVKQSNRNVIKYIKGEDLAWWWEKKLFKQMEVWSGFFPSTEENIARFCQLMIDDMKDIDILGSWLNNERRFNPYMKGAKRVVLEDLEPFFAQRPWTIALKGKKVLVIHPFAETIQMQYGKKDLIFDNALLPEFELITLKAVQTIAGEVSPFNDWFEALDFMKGEIAKIDFDIAIIGCGAYGLPLAAHVKRLGKKGFHLGGVTQLLFGIKGKRWTENPMLYYPYINLFNEHWVYPSANDTPKKASSVEGACYW